MKATRALLIVLLLGAVSAVGCSAEQGTRRPAGTTTATAPGPNIRAIRVFTAKLTPLNDSGVSGDATITVRGTTMTVRLAASGLERDQRHPIHIHGFRDLSRSRMPIGQSVDSEQLDAFIGPPLLALEPFPAPDGEGRLYFTGTFRRISMTFPLNRRAIAIHGLTRAGTYDFTLPVAVGMLAPSATGTSGGTTTNQGVGGSTGTGLGGGETTGAATGTR